jgi:hypothetical protein
VKGSADRPGDAGREPGPRPGRPPESAEFQIVRVGGRSRLSPFVVAGITALLMGMVGIAVGSRFATVTPTAVPIAAAATNLAPLVTPAQSPAPTLLDRLRDPIIPMQTSDPASTRIRLEVQRQPDELFVHGDVYVARVTWVFVSLRDATGTITGWSSVSVPGGAGTGRNGGPNMRFDVQLAIASGFTGALTIQATAYDGSGKVIGATQMTTPAELAP